ncbi:MAG: hypothetical protein LAO19_00440 [Acidobacteriia bacterium]|nr:hypothetical protein [Terriglobia bacterium]
MKGPAGILRKSALVIFVAGTIAASPAWGDTLILRSGNSVPGHLIGADGNTITYRDCDGGTRNYSVADVETIQFGGASSRGIAVQGNYNSPGDTNRNDPVCADQVPAGRIILPAGTELSIRTIDRIDSRDAAEGQSFSAQVADDIRGANGAIAIPRGADASLVTRRVEQNGEITLDVESVTLAGQRYRVSTADQEIDKRADNLGANKRTGKFVGGGAALGAIIGAIAGGGKGAAVGAVAGAGAGAGTQIITRGKEVHVPSETVLRFRLDRPLQLQAWS